MRTGNRSVAKFNLKAAIRSRTVEPRGWRFHPQAPGCSGSCFQFVPDTVSADLVQFLVQRGDSLGSRMVLPKLGRCQGRFETQDVDLLLNQLLNFMPDGRGWVCHHKTPPYKVDRESPCGQSVTQPKTALNGCRGHITRSPLWKNRSFWAIWASSRSK